MNKQNEPLTKERYVYLRSQAIQSKRSCSMFLLAGALSGYKQCPGQGVEGGRDLKGYRKGCVNVVLALARKTGFTKG